MMKIAFVGQCVLEYLFQALNMFEQVTRHIGVGQDYGGGGAVSNHGYNPNQIFLVTLVLTYILLSL